MTEYAINEIAKILPLYGFELVYMHSEWFIKTEEDSFVPLQRVFELMFINNWDRETTLKQIETIK